MNSLAKNRDSVIARYVRQARKATGLNQQLFGEEVGRTKANVSAWENGRHEPSWDLLQKMQRLSGVPMPTGTDPKLKANTQREPYDSRRDPAMARASAAELRRQGRIPLLSWQQAARWAELVDRFEAAAARDWPACPFAHGAHSFVLQVVGDSMTDAGAERSYADGDFIAVDPDRRPTHGSVVIVRLPGQRQATFRQLLIDADGRMRLRALNPDWPQRIVDLPAKAQLCGVVIGKWVAE